MSGLEIYKLLPKTNCKDCGSASCMAFAMKVAAKRAQMEDCPHISAEVRSGFAQDAPQGIKRIQFGPVERRICAGGEKVLYRHEEAFYNKPVIAVEINCREDLNEIKAKISKTLAIELKILNENESIDALVINGFDAELEKFKKCVDAAYEIKRMPLILKINNAEILKYASENLAKDKPLIYYEERDEAELKNLLETVKAASLPVVAEGANLEELSRRVKLFIESGIEEIVLCVKDGGFSQNLLNLSSLRKLAVKHKTKEFIYPVFAEAKGEDFYIDCAGYICKYASIISIPYAQPESLLALFTLRSNIFQDPRKPIQVEAKLYEIGSVNAASPVAVTTNFSLTYFAVSAEIESSRISTYLLVVDTGGTSVLSAWASDKINADKINKAVKLSGLEDKISHKNLIIPGYIYPVKEELEEISGWSVLVGPKEAKDLGEYLKKTK